MEGAFTRLSETSQDLAKNSIDLAVQVYKANLNNNPIFNGQRRVFQAISNQYLDERFRRCLREKFASSELLTFEIEDLVRRLKLESDAGDEEGIERIENEISYQHFDPKQNLMLDFTRKIAELGSTNISELNQ